MNSTTYGLVFVYAAAILLQGYVAVSFLASAWTKTMNATEVASLIDGTKEAQHLTLTFDAIEPTAGQ